MKQASNAKNTTKSTANWKRVYEQWAETKGYGSMESYAPEELNKILESFYAEVRKVNGKEYEPDSLKVMLASLDRYLKEKGFRVLLFVIGSLPPQRKC